MLGAPTREAEGGKVVMASTSELKGAPKRPHIFTVTY